MHWDVFKRVQEPRCFNIVRSESFTVEYFSVKLPGHLDDTTKKFNREENAHLQGKFASS